MYTRVRLFFKTPTNLPEEIAVRTRCNEEFVRDAIRERKGARSLLSPEYRKQLRKDVGGISKLDEERAKALYEQVMLEECRSKSFKPL